MSILLYISKALIPLIIFYVIAMGLSRKQKVYEEFVRGAMDGIRTVVKIMPTLIGLMVGVGILRASGFLDLLASVLGKILSFLTFPSELIPLIIVRMFSSSAATGLVLDLYKTYGPDSVIGLTASILMSCTETIFYTISIYYMTAKVTKTRWTLPGALISTLAGVVASVVLARWM
ncbi:MAG: spore maturation protein [Lachnospiraceae bacterium]|nr:spore maturation protein [Lachnospiraceae bacterium]